MIRDIIIYPDKIINTISPDLRLFNEKLYALIQDLKDTMNAHNSDAMAAIQIGVPMSVIVIKENNGKYTEIINPRIINKKGLEDSTESTLYFPNSTQNVKRYKKIKLIYQDRDGKQQSLTAVGERSKILQRKIDYVFGGTLANRMKNKSRKEFEKELATEGMQGSFETCPTVFKRDYIKSFIQKIFFFVILANIASFFVKEQTLSSLYTFTKYGLITAFILVIGYFFVGYYELKKDNSCSSCKMGLVTSNTIYYAIGGAVITALSVYLLKA